MRFASRAILIAAFGGVATLAACAPAAPPRVAAPVVAPEPAGPPPPAGVIAGPLGAQLSEADRQTAFDAQVDAVENGKRKSWKGKSGSFGFIETGADNGGCRDYTHTVFVDGRAQSGKGNACKTAEGGWKW